MYKTHLKGVCILEACDSSIHSIPFIENLLFRTIVEKNTSILLWLSCNNLGEKFIKLEHINEAEAEAARAREELNRAGTENDYAQRLSALEEVIHSTRQMLEWRQKTGEAIDAALSCVNMAQASFFLISLLCHSVFC
jgi:hypothetical protein